MAELQIIPRPDVDEALVAAFIQLLPQLSAGAPVPTRAQVERIAAAECTTLLTACLADGSIIGMLSLAIYPVPTGIRAHIEDVIVDADARGHGAGEALVQAALERAAAAGAKTVDLTSHPSRESANRLYLRMGFELRETNAYRYFMR